MTRAMRLAASVLGALPIGLALGGGQARAEAPGPHATPVYVLTLSTEDVDDQADALTLALRSRVRESQGWSLLELPQSFETLALALKCPPQPDARCLQRIADQIHTDHFVWGRVNHKKTATEVTAELHMWSRSQGDAQTVVSFSDNLKDASDPSLRRVASRAFGKLVGSNANGTLIVHAGTAHGWVLVDGAVKGTLEGGSGRFDVSEGTHKVTVRVSGFDAVPQDATVPSGNEQEVTFALTPAAPTVDETATGSSRPFPVRRVLGYSAIIVGGGLLVGAGIGAALWVSDSNKSTADLQHVPRTDTNVCATAASTWASYAQDACRLSKEAPQVSMASWGMGVGGVVLGATGLLLLVTDHSSSESSRDSSPHDTSSRSTPSFEVLPALGTTGGAVDVRMTF